MIKHPIWLSVLFFVSVLLAPLHAQEPLVAARQLYASAEYDDALRLLDGLTLRNYSREERQSLEMYRTLCLLAVGRRTDADRAIEAMIAEDPLFQPPGDLSPRMRAAFSDAKKRVLPAIAQRDYNTAKTAFDGQDFAAAAVGFKRVVDTLKDPEIGQAAAAPPLSDLRMLAVGFHELSVKAIPPPAAAPPAPAPPPPPVEPAHAVYSGEERNVVAPQILKQELPRFPGKIPPGGTKAVVEVVISETGAVESARVLGSVGARYDKMLLGAASLWRYQPATVNGKPVKFRKRIQVALVAER